MQVTILLKGNIVEIDSLKIYFIRILENLINQKSSSSTATISSS